MATPELSEAVRAALALRERDAADPLVRFAAEALNARATCTKLVELRERLDGALGRLADDLEKTTED